MTETNSHFKRTTEFREPPLDRPLTLLEVVQFREIAGIFVWQQSWVQISKKKLNQTFRFFHIKIYSLYMRFVCSKEPSIEYP